MDDKIIEIKEEDIEVIDSSEYRDDVSSYFYDVPEVAKPLINNAKKAFNKDESTNF